MGCESNRHWLKQLIQLAIAIRKRVEVDADFVEQRQVEIGERLGLVIPDVTPALHSARRAKEEMASLKAENEKILAQARVERDVILKEARDAKDSIIQEARSKATVEAERLLKIAREGIKNEKMAAITELKNQVATLSIDIAEKILKEELSSPDKQKQLVKSFLGEVGNPNHFKFND